MNLRAILGTVRAVGGTLSVVGAPAPVDPPPQEETILTAADGLVTVENLAVLAPLSVTAGDGLVTVET